MALPVHAFPGKFKDIGPLMNTDGDIVYGSDPHIRRNNTGEMDLFHTYGPTFGTSGHPGIYYKRSVVALTGAITEGYRHVAIVLRPNLTNPGYQDTEGNETFCMMEPPGGPMVALYHGYDVNPRVLVGGKPAANNALYMAWAHADDISRWQKVGPVIKEDPSSFGIIYNLSEPGLAWDPINHVAYCAFAVDAYKGAGRAWRIYMAVMQPANPLYWRYQTTPIIVPDFVYAQGKGLNKASMPFLVLDDRDLNNRLLHIFYELSGSVAAPGDPGYPSPNGRKGIYHAVALLDVNPTGFVQNPNNPLLELGDKGSEMNGHVGAASMILEEDWIMAYHAASGDTNSQTKNRHHLRMAKEIK